MIELLKRLFSRKIYAVCYMNYYPREIIAVFNSRKAAEAYCEANEPDDAYYEIEEMQAGV